MKRISTNKANELFFVIAMWLISRIVIIVAMQLIAPLIFPLYQGSLAHYVPVEHSALSNFSNRPLPLDYVPNFIPKPGWELFSHWDGAWYRRIATSGYEYANDGQFHNVAFFPLFPLITRVVMNLGWRFEAAGILVNNLAFLAALLLLYRWVEQRYGMNSARWVTAALAWCPFSLFCTVTYTEGLFLLVTTAALLAFDQQMYVQAALWGVMATATRSPGIALVPAFLLAALIERRPAKAYIAGIVAGGGVLLFSIYCAISFGDPLAFVHVQRAWQQPNWLEMFGDLLRFNLTAVKRLIELSMVFGGGYLLWHFWRKLPRVAGIYGFYGIMVPLCAGTLSSLDRYVYGVVSVSLALGLLLTCYPSWGYALMGLFGTVLVSFAIRFAWWSWVS